MALVPFPGNTGAARYTPPDDDADDRDLEHDGAGGKMSFLEHLDELRKRLIWSIAALFGGFLIAYAFIDYIFGFIMKPLVATLPPGAKMIYTEPTEAFMLQLKMAALAGVVIAAPIVMWQLWLFIAPGLYRREKRLALPFVIVPMLVVMNDKQYLGDHTNGAISNIVVVIVLALSFALLAIVPLRSFRELAVTMTLGLLLDAFLVRTVLVPALITLVGARGTWPGGGHSDRVGVDPPQGEPRLSPR